jgi:2-hydroxychromene-2-carboxylate isomerase
MTEQFKEQGGVSTMDPSRFIRWVSSRFMTYMASETRLEKSRIKKERKRKRSGRPHRIEYFHQVEDGYSHLAVQLIKPMLEQYDVEVVCHLVSGPGGDNLPEKELLLDLSLLDSAIVAPHYGLDFPAGAQSSSEKLIELANRILCSLDNALFSQVAIKIGRALLSGNEQALNSLARDYGCANVDITLSKLAAGDHRQASLKHYSGAMFYYEGEWYWGADRFYHLENRLIALGARGTGNNLICPRPEIVVGDKKDDGSLTFEFYPSLRSPYTSMIFDRALLLAQETGVKLSLRPVLPMVMRGVPATREKGVYIMTDTAREARALGINWGGKIYDPIGHPARRCYSLYAWANKKGRGPQLLAAFVKAAFFKGINTNNDKGMKKVIEAAGLEWLEAKLVIGRDGWQDELEANRLAMYKFGSWGVPSFRLLDAGGNQLLALWGQDRLWLFAREIKRLIEERAENQAAGIL